MDISTPTTVSIDARTCTKDGLCARVCPARIFRFTKGQVPIVQRAHECVLCGQCLAVCVSGSIAHSKLEQRGLRKIERGRGLEPDDILAFLQQRRSVRVYRNKPIPHEMLERVANMAGYAPVGAFGSAGWVRNVTIVQGEEKMRAVREATVRYMRRLSRLLSSFVMKGFARWSAEARSGLRVLPDLEMRLAEIDAGRDVVLYDAPAAMFVSMGFETSTPHEDCDAALMNMMLAAHAMGLGTCWNGWLGSAALSTHVRGSRELGDLLGLRQDHCVVEAFTIGWPVVPLHSIPYRETSIHWVS